MKATRRSAILLALAVVAASGALEAQATSFRGVDQAVLAAAPAGWDEMDRALLRQPEVGAALRAFGYRPDRLSRWDEQALARTFREMFTARDVSRDRLNRTQATALVYMALVHEGRDDRWSGTPRGPSCEAPARRILALDGLFESPGRGRPRYLRMEEQERLAEEAREIARLARGCGELGLTDESRVMLELLAPRRAERDQVARQVERMKALVQPGFRR